jgi:hypothetical protein
MSIKNSNMNISKETIEQLETLYTISFIDDNYNDVSIDKASILIIGFEKEGNYIGKTIKATKKEITLDYILNKINSENVYKNFCNTFKKLLNETSLTIYPTSYGIGVWVALSSRNQSNNLKGKIETLLKKHNILYTNEYSDAGWVFRYKISKSKDNINKIDNL